MRLEGPSKGPSKMCIFQVEKIKERKGYGRGLIS